MFPNEIGGKIEKKKVAEATKGYTKYHDTSEESAAARKSNYADMVNKYYDLATSFYEYGWGESFHFAHRLTGESVDQSLKRHEHYLAMKLKLSGGQKV